MSWSCSVDLEPLNIKWFYIILFIYIKYSSYSSRLFIEHGQIHLANGKRYSELPCTQMMCSYLLTQSGHRWKACGAVKTTNGKSPPPKKNPSLHFHLNTPNPFSSCSLSRFLFEVGGANVCDQMETPIAYKTRCRFRHESVL